MADLYYKKCDACGETEEHDDIVGGWVNLRQIVGNMEQYARIQEERVEKGDVVVDQGDFCGLVCLVNWASARQSMKELSAE